MPFNRNLVGCDSIILRSVLIVFVTLFTLPASGLTAQTQSSQEFSQRIGNTIDSTERAYFSLFPGISSFRSATVHREVDTTIVTVTRNGAPDTVIGIDPQATKLLATWIDEHEKVYRENRDMNWPVLWKYTAPAQPFDEGNEVTVTDISGNTYTGKALYADDRFLFLWPTDSLYDWKSVDSLLLAFEVTTISRIQTPDAYYHGLGVGIALGAMSSYIISGQPTSFASYILAPVPIMGLPYLGGWIGRKFFGMNSLTGGSVAEYEAIRPRLSGRSYFQRIPPELRNVNTGMRPDPAVRLMKQEPAKGEDEYPPPDERLHIMATTGKRNGVVGTYKVNVIGRFTDYETRSGHDLYCLAARYNIIPVLGIGAIYMQNNELSNDSAGTEFMNFSTYGISADFVAFPVNLPIVRQISIGMGGGVGLVRMQGGGSVACPFGYCDSLVNYSFDETQPAYFLNVGGDVYLTDFLSFHYRTQYFFTSDIKVLEGRDIVLNSTIGPVLRLKGGHTINPTFFTAMLGVQLHI